MPLRLEHVDPFDPENMKLDDCLDEVASIIARGVLRLHARIPEGISDIETVSESSRECLDQSLTSRPDRPAG